MIMHPEMEKMVEESIAQLQKDNHLTAEQLRTIAMELLTILQCNPYSTVFHNIEKSVILEYHDTNAIAKLAYLLNMKHIMLNKWYDEEYSDNTHYDEYCVNVQRYVVDSISLYLDYNDLTNALANLNIKH